MFAYLIIFTNEMAVRISANFYNLLVYSNFEGNIFINNPQEFTY